MTIFEKASKSVYANMVWDTTGAEGRRTPAYEEAGWADRENVRNIVRDVLMSLREIDVEALTSQPGQIGDCFPGLNIGWTVSIDAILDQRESDKNSPWSKELD